MRAFYRLPGVSSSWLWRGSGKQYPGWLWRGGLEAAMRVRSTAYAVERGTLIIKGIPNQL